MHIAPIDNILGLLQSAERHAHTAEQHDALEMARLVLFFIRERGQSEPFSDYLGSFNTTPLTPVISFATEEQADTWLREHPAPPHGATVGAADALYTLAYSRDPEHRKFLRLPSKEELAQWAEDGDEPGEVSQESAPLPPGLGTKWNFSDLLKWCFFHLHELEPHLSSPEEYNALEAAKIAFHFVMHLGETHGFQEYQSAVHASRTPPPSHTFASRGEAAHWLAAQTEPPPSVVIAIGDELHSVGYNRLKRLPILIRIPTPLELHPA